MSAKRRLAAGLAAVLLAGLAAQPAPAGSTDQPATADQAPVFVMPPGDHTPPPPPGTRLQEAPAPGVPGGTDRLRQIKETGQAQPGPGAPQD